jgi:hypothetical protein
MSITDVLEEEEANEKIKEVLDELAEKILQKKIKLNSFYEYRGLRISVEYSIVWVNGVSMQDSVGKKLNYAISHIRFEEYAKEKKEKILGIANKITD